MAFERRKSIFKNCMSRCRVVPLGYAICEIFSGFFAVENCLALHPDWMLSQSAFYRKARDPIFGKRHFFHFSLDQSLEFQSFSNREFAVKSNPSQRLVLFPLITFKPANEEF